MRVQIDLLPCAADLLGESPIWDHERGCLYWVDSFAPCVHRFDPSTGQQTTWQMPAPIGSVGLSARHDRLIAALKDGFYRIDLVTGVASLIGAPDPHDPASRFNDGKMDRQGRFVCGTLVPHGHPDFGKLYRLNPDDTVHCTESGVQISNSLSFALDGRTMYFADSMRRAIWAYDYDVHDGAIRNKRVLVDTAPLKTATDGACIDCDGCLWVALVEIGRVARVTPDGRIDRIVDVPAEFPSCPAFGGPGLSTLFVTSIRDTGSGRMKSARPEGGKVMAISNLGTSGVPEPRFGDG
jgi:L-arabinonolactonase